MGYKARVSKSELWKAIRNHCLICSGGSLKEREYCTVERCKLYPYRLGQKHAPCGARTPLTEPSDDGNTDSGV